MSLYCLDEQGEVLHINFFLLVNCLGSEEQVAPPSWEISGEVMFWKINWDTSLKQDSR